MPKNIFGQEFSPDPLDVAREHEVDKMIEHQEQDYVDSDKRDPQTIIDYDLYKGSQRPSSLL